MIETFLNLSPILVYPLCLIVALIPPIGTIVGILAATVYTIALLLGAGF